MNGWGKICRKMGNDVQKAVGKVYGTSRAAEEQGRGASGDITTYVDKVAEDMAVRILQKSGKKVILVSEELGEKRIGKEPEAVIILDPLDGSNNAKSGIPFFSVSIGIVGLGRTLKDAQAGYVRNLITGDEWFAAKGEGAFLNWKVAAPSGRDFLHNLAVDLHREKKDEDFRYLAKCAAMTRHLRSMGSAALELSLVSSGALDAYYQRGIRTLDICAGKIIVEEAGGVVTDFAGNSLDSARAGYETMVNMIAAANPAIHGKCLEIFR